MHDNDDQRRAAALGGMINPSLRAAMEQLATSPQMRAALSALDPQTRAATQQLATSPQMRAALSALSPSIVRRAAASFASVPTSDLVGLWEETVTATESTEARDSLLARLQVDVPSLPPLVLRWMI